MVSWLLWLLIADIQRTQLDAFNFQFLLFCHFSPFHLENHSWILGANKTTQQIIIFRQQYFVHIDKYGFSLLCANKKKTSEIVCLFCFFFFSLLVILSISHFDADYKHTVFDFIYVICFIHTFQVSMMLLLTHSNSLGAIFTHIHKFNIQRKSDCNVNINSIHLTSIILCFFFFRFSLPMI